MTVIENMMDNFASYYGELKRDKAYLAWVEDLKQKWENLQKDVFDVYTSEELYEEVQKYNEKNRNVVLLTVMLEAKESLEVVKSEGKKIINAMLDEKIEEATKYIKEAIGGMTSGATMWVYTETDIQLHKARRYMSIANFLEDQLASMEDKKEDKED